MSFILDNFGRTLQKRKESATMILISENYKTGGSKMSGQRYTVNAIRQKLGEAGNLIETVRGVGYRIGA